MALFDFARAGTVRQEMAPSSFNHLTIAHERQQTRPRGALGAAGTMLVLMGVGIGVLTIRFVFAHTVLQ